jgi:hypothetical protein
MKERLGQAALLALAMTIIGIPSAARAAVTPGLSNETLVAITGNSSFPGTSKVSGTCSDSAGSTFSFTSSGVAVGPYPGTYEARGTYTLGNTLPTSITSQQITSFSETFTITSANGTVTGTKTLDPKTIYQQEGVCQDQAGVSSEKSVYPFTTYAARITTSAGNFTDHGTSRLVLQDVTDLVTSVETTAFNESFTSDLSAAQPELPTSSDQCRNDGYSTYGVFKNQGDCLSFVATLGKNLPAGP